MYRKQSIVNHLTRLKDLCFPFSLNPLKQRKKENSFRNRNIKVKGLQWIPIEYSLETFQRSNQDTVLTNKPSVFEGSWVQSGDLLTDCASSVGGELSLGQNLLIAYMPWEGYNFEDAILISERLVVDDLYTSVHIERYDIETYETKLGSEEITRDIPNVSEKEIENLDSFGIIKMGSWVEENDILVGKVTPINKKSITPYQKLLYTILKTPFRPIRDNSLRAPKGIKAKVIDIKYFLHPASSVSKAKLPVPPSRPKVGESEAPLSLSTTFGRGRAGQLQSNGKKGETGTGQRQNLKNQTKHKNTKSLLNYNSSKNQKMSKTIKSFYDLFLINRFFSKNNKTKKLSSHYFYDNHKRNVLFSHFYKKIGFNPNNPNNNNMLSSSIHKSNLLSLQSSLDLDKRIKLWKNKLQLSKLDKRTKLTQHNFQLEKMRRKGRDYNYRSVILPSFLTPSSSAVPPSLRAGQGAAQTVANSTYFKYGQKPYFYRGVFFNREFSQEIGPSVPVPKAKLLGRKLGTGAGRPEGSPPTLLPRPSIGDRGRMVTLQKSKKRENSKLNQLISLSLKDKDLFCLNKRNLRRKNLKNIETIHIYLAEKRKIQVGDKMAGRHGNKGIVSQILPIQDMPYLPDGTPIDMVLNPLGVPSRMNVGQIYECLLGLAGKYLGEHYKVYSFDEIYGPDASRSFVFSKLYQARLKNKLDWLFNPNIPGKIRIYDGRTGECFDQPVTVGKAYMLRLVHMVDDKIHMRSTGPYSLVTQQPLRGRSKQGGQRLGEMEVWALEGYGAAFTLLEMLTIKSDDMIGRQNLWTNFILNRDISIGTPESFKVLVCELQALCLDIGLFRYSETLDSTFTDPNLNINMKESIHSSTKPYLREIPHLINLP
jgi:DNA-directed RNA polymerase subunit beta